MPRRFKITKRMLTDHGYSARCEGCKAALEGSPSQNHSESCRKRILEAIGGKEAPEVEAQQRRYDTFIDKAATKEDADEVQREKKRVRSEGPEGGRTFRRLQLFVFLKKRSWRCKLEARSEFPKTTAERISTKHSWKLRGGRPNTHLRF